MNNTLEAATNEMAAVLSDDVILTIQEALDMADLEEDRGEPAMRAADLLWRLLAANQQPADYTIAAEGPAGMVVIAEVSHGSI